LSLARVIVRPKESKLWIDYATKADQTAKDMATALVVFGLPSGPVVERNGNPCRAMFRTVKIDGQEAYVIPLAEDTSEAVLKGVVERYRRAQEAFEKIQGQPDVSQTLLQARGG
jgi:hypothetical protein